ncbi:MAG: tetratricopeptide repeat protein, partial [Syntrophobacteraceae bacterium]
MFTVTFYSYKGGVGRTLALANVAYTLATEGGKQRVMVVDFDLEAPGIDAIAPFDSGKATEKGGIVEYIAEYAKGREASPDALPSLLPYAREVDGIPNLMVMPAGKKDSQYQETLTCLNWESFYKFKHGYRFFEQFKRKIEQEFSPDYLLVDSRTGLADVAGITTHQLADLVVLVFNLNRQNLDGITRCYQSIVSAAKPRPIKIMLVASPIPKGHLLDSNLVESKLKEAADAMPDVVSSSGSGDDRIIQIPYHPALSLMDVAFVRIYPTDEISRIYRRIVETVQKSNPAEIKFLLEKAFRYRDENRFEEAEEEFNAVIEQHPRNAEGHYIYGDFLMKREEFTKAIAQLDEACRLAANKNSRYLYSLGLALARVNRNEAALEKLEMAERIDSADEAILRGISGLFSKMGDSTRALEYWRKINRAKPPATKLERLQHSRRFAAMCPGFLSSNLSLPKDFDRHGFLDRLEKAIIFDYATKAGILESMLNQSFSSQQIQELNKLLVNQQSVLSDQLGDYFALVQSKVRQGELNDMYDEKDLERLIESEDETGANAFRLCLARAKMADSDYRGAIDIVAAAMETPIPESCQALFYQIWGDAIVELARQTDDVARKIEMLQEATEKYRKIILIKPDKHEGLFNWGGALWKLADLREGPERETLLKEAAEKYAR